MRLVRPLTVVLAATLLAAAPADPAQAVRVTAISYAQTQLHIGVAVLVEPVAIVDDYALADWVAGVREGEVLLQRSSRGKWRVIDFDNSSFADAHFLTVRFAVPPATAAALVKGIRAAEKRQGSMPH